MNAFAARSRRRLLFVPALLAQALLAASPSAAPASAGTRYEPVPDTFAAGRTRDPAGSGGSITANPVSVNY